MDGDLPVYDLVGIGFGPSNLALAIAATEHNAEASETDQVSVRFLERQASFGWHRGMLLDDATMQVSFLKDLVTLRNPASRFSFLSFLHDRGRLIDFINHKSLFPLRLEFHEYLEWASGKVEDLVSWSSEVTRIEPVRDGETIAYLDVTTVSGDGEAVTYRARNVVLGTGLIPRLPAGVTASARVWHSEDLLRQVEQFEAGGESPVRPGSSWSEPGRVRPRSPPSCTSATRQPRSVRCSRVTATARPTTARSPTGSSTRPRWTTSTTLRPRSRPCWWTTTGTRTTPWWTGT